MSAEATPPRYPSPLARLRALLGSGPGPAVARAQHSLLGAVFFLAFSSLGAQLLTLYGQRGLLPIARWADAVHARGLPWWQAPSLLRLAHSDRALQLGVLAGQALGLCALLGVAPRVSLFASAALYLSFASAGQTFTGFQWDSLLVEAGMLAAFIPRTHRAPLAWLALRVALFKVYFESGLAKLGSPAGDWLDGSAMTRYYETAPLPAWPAWYAHHLPAWWHHFESRAVLALELLAPLGLFATRRVRYGCALILAAFQLVNLATANYGFFVWLTLALHLSVLDEADVAPRLARVWARVPARVGRFYARLDALALRPSQLRAGLFTALVALPYGALSYLEARASQGEPVEALEPLRQRVRPFRVANAYHLFASITPERVEPLFEVLRDGRWQRALVRYKPGDPAQAPGFVAPHQPRVAFQLWFYGLSWQADAPVYVQRIQERLCADPDAVQLLFSSPLPAGAQAVRTSFARYRFTTREERARSGAWWSVEPLPSGTTTLDCATALVGRASRESSARVARSEGTLPRSRRTSARN